MTAGIYVEGVRFFQAVTEVASGWQTIPDGDLTTSSFCGAFLWALQGKKFVKTSSPVGIRDSPPPLVQGHSLPGECQAPVRAKPCPEFRGVFVSLTHLLSN